MHKYDQNKMPLLRIIKLGYFSSYCTPTMRKMLNNWFLFITSSIHDFYSWDNERKIWKVWSSEITLIDVYGPLSNFKVVEIYHRKSFQIFHTAKIKIFPMCMSKLISILLRNVLRLGREFPISTYDCLANVNSVNQ